MENDNRQKSVNIKFPDGSCGLWESKTIGTKSWLYPSSTNTITQNQKIVDRENCALWWPYGKGHAVIDHAGSYVGGGIWNVQNMKVDDSAVLTLPDGTKKYYTCVGLLRCKRRNSDYAWDGSAFAPIANNDVVCISCATKDGSEVYVAYYKHNYTIEQRSVITSTKK